jgi:predicted RNase H-like HicB family nuclease
MKFTVKIFKGDKYYVARVPELGVTTQGKTKEEAKKTCVKLSNYILKQ